jgi:hypothetical protein
VTSHSRARDRACHALDQRRAQCQNRRTVRDSRAGGGGLGERSPPQERKGVIFGSTSAALIDCGDTSDVLIVRATALPEGRVQVTLETDVEYQGISVSDAGDYASGATNAYFTQVK